MQASNTSLSAQLADAQVVLTRERQLHTDRTTAAEQLWQERINDLLGQVSSTVEHDATCRSMQCSASHNLT